MIIFVDHIYGIMDIAECMLRLNVKVKDFENVEASKTGILKRYGVSLIWHFLLRFLRRPDRVGHNFVRR